MQPSRLRPLLTLLLAASPLAGQGAEPATAREYQAEFTTYPFSDPNPIPVMGRIYPYFRFDGFTDVPVARRWKVIDLENRWIRVSILPEIGGKIWRAIDKTTGKSFIYDNHVVKFRDIAMRGPWTSGGIEANYGIIGHTPNVATPVDYTVQRFGDGRVTCTIGALDLLTRTSWRLTITLPADKAYFTTSSFWHNGTPFEQPYYSWMNAAIPAGDDLEFIYPGNHFLGHGGEVGDWPVNRTNGHTVSNYRENDFGGYKSYHVFGAYTDFFGAYWHKQDFGMARYAPHDEKPGKKLWIWGLSRQGMIWEQLLTDADGQYTEVQSGRLFNQTAEASSLTPFKHRGYAPYSSDRWTEYWTPVKGTDGFVMANPVGALNVQQRQGRVVLSLSPVEQLSDSLIVDDGGRRVYAALVRRTPLERWRDSFATTSDLSHLHVTLGGHKLEWSGDTAATRLSRPLTSPPNFDWKSSYGLYLSGKEKLRERDYRGARLDFDASLRADSNYLPALTDLAALDLRLGAPDEALRLARRALSIDSYDPAANFTWGEINRRAGRRVDARDGYDIASQSVEYRSAAWTALAKMYLQDGALDRATDYALKALDYDRFNLDAWQVRAVAARLGGDRIAAGDAMHELLTIDPLSSFALTEVELSDGGNAPLQQVAGALQNEMPGETLLELAIWYVDVGQLEVAERLLAAAPPQPEIGYWRAWLHQQLGRSDVAAMVHAADAMSPRLVFPSRMESIPVMRWAMEQSESWMPAWFLALLQWNQGDEVAARELLDRLGERPAFAPFYAARAELRKTISPESALADLRHAARLDPAEWRYGRLLAERAMADSQFGEAVRLAGEQYRRAPRNSSVEILYARALLRNGDFTGARRLLDTVVVLPYEGAGEAHALFREANLLSAVARIRARDARGALTLIAHAREWPERLGAGKPYPQDVDERLEDLLVARARNASSAAEWEQQADRLLAGAVDPVVVRVLGALRAPVSR